MINRRDLLAAALLTSTGAFLKAATTTPTLNLLTLHDSGQHTNVLDAVANPNSNYKTLAHLLPAHEKYSSLFSDQSAADLPALDLIESAVATNLPSPPTILTDSHSITLGKMLIAQQGRASLTVPAGIKAISQSHIFDFRAAPTLYTSNGQIIHATASAPDAILLSKMSAAQILALGLGTATSVASLVSPNQVQLTLNGSITSNQAVSWLLTHNNGVFDIDLATSVPAVTFGAHLIAGPAAAIRLEAHGFFSKLFKKFKSAVKHLVTAIKSAIHRYIRSIPSMVAHWAVDRIAQYAGSKLLALLPAAASFA